MAQLPLESAASAGSGVREHPCDVCQALIVASNSKQCDNASRPGEFGNEIIRDQRRHVSCTRCLQQHVQSLPAIAIDLSSGRIPCPVPRCRSSGWPVADVAGHVDKATVTSVMLKLSLLADAARRKRDLEAQMQRRIATGLGTASVLSALTARGGAGASWPAAVAAAAESAGRAALLAEVIRERDLTLRCPRCSLPCAETGSDGVFVCGSKGFLSPAAAGAAERVVEASSGGCGACLCGGCLQAFARAAAVAEHRRVHHGGALDTAHVHRMQAELRASAAAEALYAFGRGQGGADLQRAVAAALGDAALERAGLSVATLLERASVPAIRRNSGLAPAAAACAAAAPSSTAGIALVPAAAAAYTAAATAAQPTVAAALPSVGAAAAGPVGGSRDRADDWICATCTLENAGADESCSACEARRPRPAGTSARGALAPARDEAGDDDVGDDGDADDCCAEAASAQVGAAGDSSARANGGIDDAAHRSAAVSGSAATASPSAASATAGAAGAGDPHDGLGRHHYLQYYDEDELDMSFRGDTFAKKRTRPRRLHGAIRAPLKR